MQSRKMVTKYRTRLIVSLAEQKDIFWQIRMPLVRRNERKNEEEKIYWNLFYCSVLCFIFNVRFGQSKGEGSSGA